MMSDPLQRRIKMQRVELRRLSRAMERQSLYMREQVAHNRRMIEATSHQRDLFVKTTCPWCRFRRGLRYPSIHGWQGLWWRVRYRFWWQIWAGPKVAAKRAYDAGVRETLAALGQSGQTEPQ